MKCQKIAPRRPQPRNREEGFPVIRDDFHSRACPLVPLFRKSSDRPLHKGWRKLMVALVMERNLSRRRSRRLNVARDNTEWRKAHARKQPWSFSTFSGYCCGKRERKICEKSLHETLKHSESSIELDLANRYTSADE